MKKRLFILVFALCSLSLQAWEVGDLYMDSTGVPGIVIYLDQTGAHGLIMSPCAPFYDPVDRIKSCNQIRKEDGSKFARKLYMKEAVRHGANPQDLEKYLEEANKLTDVVLAYMPDIPQRYRSKISEKEEREMLLNIARDINGFGIHNQQVIIDYCERNNIDMQYYFPNTEWAIRLGEGWFIPGNHELELACRSFSDGIGIPMGDNHEMQRRIIPLTWKTWYLWRSLITTCFEFTSSTCIDSPWEAQDDNKAKTIRVFGTHGDLYGGIRDNYYVLGTALGSHYYSLISNYQDWGRIVAFKYF